MIQLRSDGEILDLAPNQSISISIANPFFESDRIPAAVSTPIEFKDTAALRRIFQYVPGPMLTPQRRKLPAEILCGGIPLWTGELHYEELSEESSLSYTFVGACFEDIVSGKLTDIPFTAHQNVIFKDFISEIRKEESSEFGLPMIIRKDFSAKIEYRTSTAAKAYPECSVTDKYANWPYTNYPYVIPALKVRHILENILPNLIIESGEVNHLLDYLAILGLYKNKKLINRWGVEDTTPGRPTQPYTCNIDLADSLPEMSTKDFFLNILKMTCSCLYCLGKSFVIHSNKSILTSSRFFDWTDKISDIYSCSVKEGQSYTLRFQNEPDNYANKYSDEPGEEAVDSVQEWPTMTEVLSAMMLAKDYINVRHTPSGDVYSGKKVEAVLYYRNQYVNSYSWSSFTTVVPTLDIVHQAGFNEKKPTAGIKADSYDCTVDFQVPRCIPTHIFTTKWYDNTGLELAQGLYYMAPIVEFPTPGETRPDTVYIGLLINNNFTDKDTYFSDQVLEVSCGTERISDLSLAIDGPKGLYETLHKPFAEWIAKNKDIQKINLNLTVQDIANLKMWVKYMFYNRLFYFRNIDFEFNTSTDTIYSSAEIVEA